MGRQFVAGSGLSRDQIDVTLASNADVLILAGMSLILGSVPGLILVPVLAGVLQERFIKGEEARLAEAFGAEFAAYRDATRRWI